MRDGDTLLTLHKHRPYHMKKHTMVEDYQAGAVAALAWDVLSSAGKRSLNMYENEEDE